MELLVELLMEILVELLVELMELRSSVQLKAVKHLEEQQGVISSPGSVTSQNTSE